MQYLLIVISSSTDFPLSHEEVYSFYIWFSFEQFQPRIKLWAPNQFVKCKVWITSDLKTFQLSDCSHGLAELRLISWSTAISRSHVFSSVVCNFHFRVISTTAGYFLVKRWRMFGKHCLLHIKSAAVPFAICAVLHATVCYMHSGELQCTVCSVVELCWTCVCKCWTTSVLRGIVLNYRVVLVF